VTVGLPADLLDSLHLPLLGRLLLASLLGGAIGLEREISGKPAGLRTNLLICVGAALLMELSIGLARGANEANVRAGAPFRSDPARIAAQIVSGIGFIGAGSILQARGGITGLTTAATIWVVAAIGMAVGARAYVEAVGSTVLVVVSLVLLARLEGLLVRRRRFQRYRITLHPDPELVGRVADLFRAAGLRVESQSVEKRELYEAQFDVTGPPGQHTAVLQTLLERSGVHRVTREL